MTPITGVLQWRDAGALGRTGWGATLYAREQLDCMELCLGMDEELMENLWVRIKDRTGKDDITVLICYRPPNKQDKADEALYRQIRAASRSQAPVFMGNFNYPDICWRENTAGHKQSRGFLESIDDNIWTQVIKQPKKERYSAGLHTHKQGEAYWGCVS